MTITANIGTGPIAILAADTDFFTVPNERIHITAFNVRNSTGASENVTIFISPNATSASGEDVGELFLGINSSEDANEIVGQGYVEGDHIILVGSTTGMTASMTYTLYDGGD